MAAPSPGAEVQPPAIAHLNNPVQFENIVTDQEAYQHGNCLYKTAAMASERPEPINDIITS